MMISTIRCLAVFLVVLLLASTGGGAKKDKKSKQSKESKKDGVPRGQPMKQKNLPPGLAKKCEKPSLCLPNPCKNSGKCSVEDGGSGFHCTCPPPYTGVICDSEKPSLCLPNPCKNSGKCSVEDGGSGFHCTCPPPYTGVICDSVVMDVANSASMLLFDSDGRKQDFYGTIAYRVAVKDYLAIQAEHGELKGFIIRVNGKFLDGDKIQCRNATETEAQWTEANFKVPADGTWANPERGIAVSKNFKILEEDGSSYQPSTNLSLWMHSETKYIFCRLELDDLNLLE